MGNVPAKETRSRSNTYSSGSSGDVSAMITRTGGARRNTVSSSFLNGASESKKLRKQEDKDRQREQHFLNLIVRFTENVDGGYLAPFGTYKSNLDHNTEVVRSLIISRELAPFYTPLQDFDESWTDEELLIILSQLTLHSIETAYSEEDTEDDVDKHKIHKSANYYKRQEQKAKLQALTEKMKELQKEEENKFLEEKMKIKMRNLSSSTTSEEIVSPNIPSRSLLFKLYRKATECPICFLYYPRKLNISRCCFQPICTECFVQIKRMDPHPPHDDRSNEPGSDKLPHSLVSEPASCPYCALPNFGVTYEPPYDISTGIKGKYKPGYYTVPITSIREDSEAVMSSSPGSGSGGTPLEEVVEMKFTKKKPRRRSSLAADAKGVITIDQIRPDWEIKLTTARNKLARKAATASAIHASNLLLNGDDDRGSGSGSPPYETRRRGSGANSHLQTVEDRMLEEALRLSIIDEDERKRKVERASTK